MERRRGKAGKQTRGDGSTGLAANWKCSECFLVTPSFSAYIILLIPFARVREGEGQVALIIGEAGIGKSRLVHRFRETLTGTPHGWIDAAAGAFYQNTPFYPVIEMLRQALFAGGDGCPAHLRRWPTR